MREESPRTRSEYEALLERLLGRRIEAVTYYEIPYPGGLAAWGEVSQEFDSLDFGLSWRFEDGTEFSFTWGHEFSPYGVSIGSGSMRQFLYGSAHGRWDVSTRWARWLSAPITEVGSVWLPSDAAEGVCSLPTRSPSQRRGCAHGDHLGLRVSRRSRAVEHDGPHHRVLSRARRARVGCYVPPAMIRVEEFETERGTFVAWRHGPGLVASVATGHMEVEVARALIRIGEAERRRHPERFVHFLDWREVTGYSSEGRKLCTEWALRQKPPYPELHIVTSHRLVNMGVSAAGLALAVAGRKLESYQSHTQFTAALARHGARS